MPASPLPSRRRRLALIALATLAVLAGPVAALAHPFGPPPRSWLEVDGDTVSLSWEAAYDDYLALGELLGYFEPGTAAAYLEPDVQVAPPRAAEEELAASDELRSYLRENIVVSLDGRQCDPDRVETDRFVEQGAVVHARCPTPVETVEIRITMLHDINEAYRTFGLADGEEPGPFAVFTAQEPAHLVDLAELEGADGRGRLVLLGAVLALGVMVPLAVRRLTRGAGP
jgi:hypothetical protein